MSTKLFGELQAEKNALESAIARKIANEISAYGVNDRQRWLLIYFLGLELEKVEEMQAVAGFIRDVKGDLFLRPEASVEGPGLETKTTFET